MILEPTFYLSSSKRLPHLRQNLAFMSWPLHPQLGQLFWLWRTCIIEAETIPVGTAMMV
jgi:hypothetical protein